MEQRTGVAATLAIIVGIIGLFMSASPRVSGGILSIAAIIIAVLGMGFSLLGIAGSVLF